MRKAIVCTLFSLFFLACGKMEQGAEAPDTPTVQAGKKEEGGWIELTTPVPENNTGSEQGSASMQEQFGHKLEHLVKIGEDSPYYSNLEENLGIGFSMNPVLVCPDPVYGITYLVNSGRDYLIYAIRDQKAEIAVELPAKSLFCRNGELYFIVEDYGNQKLSGVKKGDIVRYQPQTGNVEVLVSDDAYNMRVYPDCILYEQMVEAGEGYTFVKKSFSFETGKTGEIDATIHRWKNLTMYLDASFDTEAGRYFNDYRFVDENGKECRYFGRQSAVSLDLLGTEGRISGDDLYLICRKNRKLYTCNMITGEIRLTAEAPLPPKVTHIYDYIYFQNRFLFVDGYSVKKEEKTGTVLYRLDKYNTIKHNELAALFTDGTNLYGLLDNKLYRLEFVRWNREEQYVPGGYVWDIGAENEFSADTDEYYLKLCEPF